jgi:hypothetical protein
MFNVSFPEVIIIIILVLILGLPWILITNFLKKKYPGRMWLGILLTIIFVPFGQLYLDGGIYWMIALIILLVLSKTLNGGAFLGD